MTTVSTPRISRPYLRRERLTAVLDRGEPITVVRAPMGFGKTALVADWVTTLSAERQASTVWITVEPDWDDPALFWSELVASLTAIGVTVRDPDRPGPAAVRASLLAHAQPITLVVDAVDRMAQSAVPSGLVELVRRVPLVQLIVCTRARVLDRATWLDLDGAELNADDLALTEDESRQLLQLFGVDLPDDGYATVSADVLGWPLALRAVALALGEAGQPYVIETALAQAHRQLRESVLSFIEEAKLGPSAFPASLLSDFTGEELEAEVAVGFGATTGEELAAAGLVVADAGDQVRYRWPPIIGRIVADEFAAVEPERVAELHVLLADHYIARDVPLPAMIHAARAQDWARVEIAIGRTVGRLLLFYREDLRDVFAMIPEPVIASSVMLSATREYLFAIDDGHAVVSGWSLPASNDELRAIVRSGNARIVMNEAGIVTIVLRRRGQFDQSREVTLRLSAMASLMRTEHLDDGTACSAHLVVGINHLHAYERDEASRAFRTAYREGQRPDAPFDHVPRDAGGKLALMHAVTGEISRAQTWLEQSEDTPVGHAGVRPYLEGTRAAVRTLIAVEQGDVDSIATHLAGVLAAPQYEDFWLLLVHAHARAALLLGDPASALRVITTAEARERRSIAHPWIASLLLADEIDLNLAAGNGSRAQALLNSAEVGEAAVLVARARIALIGGDVAAAIDDARATRMADHSSVYLELQALLIEAVALHRQGQVSEAAEVLTAAVSTARAEQAFAAFATVPRSDLTAVLASANLNAPDFDAALARLPEIFPSTLSSISLTARERVILGYLDAGLTLNAIARRETVSINTVKSQYRTVYRKLGASRREDALRIARAAGLID
jgi:LuxR family maltose regulon positive regulatory protein